MVRANQNLVILDEALKLAAAGFSVFPCWNAPGQEQHKRPLVKGGYKAATTDAAQVTEWWTKWPAALIGLPTGARNGVAVLDLDKKNGKDGFAAVPGWETLSPLRSITGSGGAHLFFRASQPIRCATGADGVDVRGERGYAIVPPSAGYEWAAGNGLTDPMNLPHFPVAYLPRYRAPDPSDEGLLANDPALVAPALRAIPNDDLDWEEWNRIGMATWAATGGSDDGLEAWDEWSQKSAKYSSRATANRWAHFHRSPPSQIGFGALFWEADNANPDWLTRFELEQEAAALAAFEEGQAMFFATHGSATPDREPASAPEPPPEAPENPGSGDAGEAEQPEAEPSPAEPSDTPEGPFSRLFEWNAGDDDWAIPPRKWLLGNTYCRQFVSSLIADGGVGKSALRVLQALSCATGKPLTGEKVFERCRVMFVSLEDDRDELRRRVKAAMIHHGIDREEVAGWLFLSAPEGKAGKLVKAAVRGGRVNVGPMLAELKAAITGRHIDLLIIDPLVKAHDVEENDNSAMDIVISTLAELAIEHNIAVDVLHHTSKGAADPGNADRGRGASAVKNGARLVYTLTPMSQDEARLFGINEAARRSYVRLDSGKVNITPSLERANWFRLLGVQLGNRTALYPNGDNVQTMEAWLPPDAWEGLTDDIKRRILDEIEAGVPEDADSGRVAGSRYSDSPTATWRAAWPVVARNAPDKTEPQCRTIIADWIRNRVLVAREYRDPNDRRKVKGLFRANERDDADVPM